MQFPCCFRRSYHQNNREPSGQFYRNIPDTHLIERMLMLRDRTTESDEKTMVKESGTLTGTCYYALLKRQFQEKQLEVDRIRHELSRRRKDNRETIKVLQKKLSLEKEEAEKSAREWAEKEKRYEKEYNGMLERKEHYKKRAQEAESARKMSIMEKQDMSALLQAQSMELAAAEAFLSQTDPMSEQEVLQLVQDLNSEVVQIAASLAEDIDETGGQVDQEIIRTVAGICGTKLAAELPRHDPELTEIAIKTAIVYFTEMVAKEWLGNTVDDCTVLDGIYKRICDSQEQQVAGKWRALTRTHLNHDDKLKMVVTDEMTHSLANIMLCAGQPWDHKQAQEFILKRVSNRLETLIDLAFQLNQVFGIKMTSADFSVFHGREGGRFKRNTMDPYYGEESISKDSSCSCYIIGAVELGLVRRKRVGAEIKEKILLKAKVVLDHDLVVLTE